MINQLQPEGGWNIFKEPKPNVTTSGFAFDAEGRFPVLYRGSNVRSARNVWSLPSGLHECGFTLADQLCVELKEECSLEVLPDSVRPVCVYENIAPDMPENPGGPQWHWVIHVLACRVKSLDSFVNKEPDKHPHVEFITVAKLPEFVNTHPFHPTLRNAILENFSTIMAVQEELLQR